MPNGINSMVRGMNYLVWLKLKWILRVNMTEENNIKEQVNSLASQFDYVFGAIIMALLIVSYLIYDMPYIAMYFGFALAGFSAIANDSLQTLGTFIASNKHMPKWILVFFIGGILVSTMVYGWAHCAGDIAFGRLKDVPAPKSFNYIELSAPIVLLIMTRLRMPVSTTFLLLSIFSNHFFIKQMILKSAIGYVIAFLMAYVTWFAFANYFKKISSTQTPAKEHYKWLLTQYVITGFLWSLWIMHDMANIVVYLPRQLSVMQLLFVVCFLFGVVTVVLYFDGGKIQKIVDEKSSICHVKTATIVDLLYVACLFLFKEISNIPMSTTWVFIGLLGGRELAYQHFVKNSDDLSGAKEMICKDFFRAGLGLIISIVFSLFA